MTILRNTALSLVIATVAFGAYAQTDADHAQHHPAASTKKISKPAEVKANPVLKESMTNMDSQMKVMREMHEKMMSAKTPEERKALMADHMKAMQDGMSMMNSSAQMDAMKSTGGMGSDATKGGMPMGMMAHHEMMEKRMEMMTTMMQMMMDRLPTPAVP